MLGQAIIGASDRGLCRDRIGDYDPATTSGHRGNSEQRRPRPGRRAVALLRNGRLVHARSGARGLAELLLARALPTLASYRRATIIAVPTAGGQRHPELSPRVVRALDPELEQLFRSVAKRGEPEVNPLTAPELEEAFACGSELWLFSLAGEVSHLAWVGVQPLLLAGLTLAVTPQERRWGGVVTLPRARQRGLAAAAVEHLRATLEERGVERLVGAVNGFNRAFLAGCLRNGFQTVATLRSLSLGGRTWTRVEPATSSDAALLAARGVPCGRWTRVS